MNTITLNHLFSRDNISSARKSRYRTDKIVKTNVVNISSATPLQRASSIMSNNARGSIFCFNKIKDSKVDIPTSPFESLTTLRVDSFE